MGGGLRYTLSYEFNYATRFAGNRRADDAIVEAFVTVARPEILKGLPPNARIASPRIAIEYLGRARPVDTAPQLVLMVRVKVKRPGPLRGRKAGGPPSL